MLAGRLQGSIPRLHRNFGESSALPRFAARDLVSRRLGGVLDVLLGHFLLNVDVSDRIQGFQPTLHGDD